MWWYKRIYIIIAMVKYRHYRYSPTLTALNCEHELVLAAMTGTAAIKIRGSTVHSAVGIPVEYGDKSRIAFNVRPEKMRQWTDRRYLIIDEVSMMDSRVIASLHCELGKIKSKSAIPYGRLNLLFFGDFLQFPAVFHLDLYIDCDVHSGLSLVEFKCGFGHRFAMVLPWFCHGFVMV